MMIDNKSLPPTPKVIPKSVKMAGATTTKSIEEASMKSLGSLSLAKATPIGNPSSGEMPKVKPQLTKVKVDEEEYEADEDALDDDSHDVGQPIREEELEADEDQNEEQMTELATDVQAEASDDEEANEGSGDEVYSVQGAKLHAVDEEDEADVEGHEEGIDGYEYDEDQICTEEIRKRFNAMQHSMQQALAEMHQTFIWLQRELEEAITAKIVAAQTRIETKNKALFQNHLSQALGEFERQFISTLSLSYTTFDSRVDEMEAC
ncbi:hypothetical protein Sjap_011525 [Stephania japonica]|uniref:Uncharacterized protein n=1 Tax=Stephania japonica TaxID=461633 RepID=A0AAP0JBP1_9MAGN